MINPSIIEAMTSDKALDITILNLPVSFSKTEAEQYMDIINDENEAKTNPFTILPSI